MSNPIEADITRLLDQAAAEPGQQDPMGMVGFAATWLAATLYVKSHKPDKSELAETVQRSQSELIQVNYEE